MEGLGSGAAMIDAGMHRQHARTLQLEGLDADGFLAYTRTRHGGAALYHH